MGFLKAFLSKNKKDMPGHHFQENERANPSATEKSISQPLSSVERSLLKYLSGRDLKFVPAQYWYYEYGIDCEKEIHKFQALNLLEITNKRDVNSLTVLEVKAILKGKKISTTGNKKVLTDRLLENFSESELDSLLPPNNGVYALTTLGTQITKSVHPSVTKDIELEDACLKDIRSGDYNSAFRKIATFRAMSPGKSGLGIDWKTRASEGLDNVELEYYENMFWGAQESERPYREGMILCEMLGNPGKLRVLMKRLLDPSENINNAAIDAANYAHHVASSLQDIRRYKEDGIKKYEILGTVDEKSCSVCKRVYGKHFLVSKAEIGVNLPPFCNNCRCTTIPL